MRGFGLFFFFFKAPPSFLLFIFFKTIRLHIFFSTLHYTSSLFVHLTSSSCNSSCVCFNVPCMFLRGREEEVKSNQVKIRGELKKKTGEEEEEELCVCVPQVKRLYN